MKKNTSFHLSKWYLDCVTDDGRAFIGYAATLTWKGVKVPYASFLYLRTPGEVFSKTRFRNVQAPDIWDGLIHWHDAPFQIDGTWEAAAAPVSAKLHESEAGGLDWQCYQPASKCRIQFQNEPPLEGWGYAERLDMTVPPWLIGIGDLRWGRFAVPPEPLVWIELTGPPLRRWVFNGQSLVEDASVSDLEIRLPSLDFHLRLEHPVVIEDESKIMHVVRSLARYLPGFDRFTPLRFLQAHETKWLSEGRLMQGSQVLQSGRVIHELVRF